MCGWREFPVWEERGDWRMSRMIFAAVIINIIIIIIITIIIIIITTL